jgi:hypothetical protein
VGGVRLLALTLNMFNNFLGGLSSGNGSGGGGDALPTAARNGVTFDEIEATADFANQLGPPPAADITQTQGDAPAAGYILPPALPGVGGGLSPPPSPPQQAGMGGGSSPPGRRHTPASTPSSKNWGERCTTRHPFRPSSPCN